MGRMKGSPSGGEVNPLQRMLGTFLRLERARLGYSTKDVADRLGLTDTYFRLVESGRAALNQSLAFALIEIFAASTTPTRDSRTISFNRLAVFLVGTHWVGSEMASQRAHGSAGKRAMETLAALVGDFQIFHEQTRGYFDLQEGDDQKQFLEEVAAPAVGIFLRSEVYGNAESAVRDFLRVDDVPTMNIDIVLDLKRSLADRSFVHTQKIAARWESERASQFQYFRAVFKRPDLIVNQGNLDIFHYEYLLRERFLEGQFIFVDSEKDEATLRREFVRLQNIGRKKVPALKLDQMSQKEIAKLKFVCLSQTESEAYKLDLEEIFSHDERLHEAYWSFETHYGLHISFIGLYDNNMENIRNLNLRDADQKADTFNRLWTTINAARQN